MAYEEGVYGLRGKGPAVTMDRDWWDEVKTRGRVCGRCFGVPEAAPPLDVVVECPPPKAAESLLRIAEHDVVERRLLEVLGLDLVERHLVTSRLLDRNGREFSEYLVIRPLKWTCVRANRQDAGRSPLHCPQCGRCLGALMGHGRYYVTRASLGLGPLWGSNLHSVLVNEELQARLRHHRWRQLILDRLPVLDEPRDGLPDVLPHYVDLAKNRLEAGLKVP